MLITKSDFFDMGFTTEEKDEELLERCIKRAEFVLNGLTGNRASVIAAAGGEAGGLVRQAAAFQTNAILKEELALAAKKTVIPDQSESRSDKNEERVSIGDFSYSTGTSESRSTKSSTTLVDNAEKYVPLDHDKTVVRLLRAAGCFYSGTEVLE